MLTLGLEYDDNTPSIFITIYETEEFIITESNNENHTEDICMVLETRKEYIKVKNVY